MRIAIGSDHAGFNLKEYIKQVLAEKLYEYEDMGCFDTASVDYPDVAFLVSDSAAYITGQTIHVNGGWYM